MRGRAAHAQLTLDPQAFADHLARVAGPEPAAELDGRLHAEDLYLACAAVAGADRAADVLRAQLHPAIVRYVRCVDPSPDFVEEVEQQFWCAALLPGAAGACKLAGYSGRGPLAVWAGVSAQRMALSLHRHGAAERRAAERQRLQLVQLAVDAEVAQMKGHLRGRFRDAVSRALEVLDRHQRLLFRMHLIDGVSLQRIGHMYGVSHSTISRQLAAARGQVVDEVRRLLGESSPGHGGAPDDDSLGRFLDSDLELSISRLLATGPAR
ncbi:MAG TPA: sigma-70 family RNA polymerase sigma factor [Polyangia bacterium]|nr:sigma-70 family RNA polymerase sigma factor [Polyangia bacterium]